MGQAEKPTSISYSPSFLHQSQTVTEKTVVDLHRERFPFPLVSHLTDTRTPPSLAAEALRGDQLATQYWNQQGISLTWSHFQTDEKLLFSQQPWEVTPHRF